MHQPLSGYATEEIVKVKLSDSIVWDDISRCLQELDEDECVSVQSELCTLRKCNDQSLH